MTQKFFYLHSVCVSTGKKMHSVREALDIHAALAARVHDGYHKDLTPVAWSESPYGGKRPSDRKILQLHDEAIAAGRLIVKDEKIEWRAVVPDQSAVVPDQKLWPVTGGPFFDRFNKNFRYFATLVSNVNQVKYQCYYNHDTGAIAYANKNGDVYGSESLKYGLGCINGIASVAAKEAHRRFVEGKATITADMSRNVSRAQAERMHEEAHAMQLAQYERESRNEKPKAPLTWAKPAPFDPFKGFFDHPKPVTMSNSERRVEKTRGAFGASPDLQATNPLAGSASLMLGMGD